MSSVLLGLVGALAWGLHDFLARFPSRAVGPIPTVFCITLAGLLFLSAWLLFAGEPLSIDWGRIWLPALSGVSLVLATLSLFTALTLAPLSLVAPIAGAYPALAMLIAVAQGMRPSALQWLAVACVMAGVAVVSRGGTAYEEGGHVAAGKLPLVLALCLLASLGFAGALICGQASVPIYGEIAAVWLARSFGLIAIAAICLFARTTPVPAPRWLPLLVFMGALDVTALGTVVSAGALPDPAFATVVSSAFGAVTVVLARLFLKEPIAPLQAFGMALIFGGVAALAGV